MWTIHRVESVGGNLIVYACNPDGGEFPHWAIEKALIRSAESLPCTLRAHGTVRALTANEMKRELREAAECEVALNTVCVGAGLAVDNPPVKMRLYDETVAYAAIDFPGAGWRGDSAAYVHIPIGE